MVCAWIYVEAVYRTGKGVERSEEKAYEACQLLSENGLGVQTQDLSLQYYMLSAEQKYFLALCSLVEWYKEGTRSSLLIKCVKI